MNIFEMYKAGGPYMNLISVMVLITVFITVLKVKELVVNKIARLNYLDLILMAGSLAIAIGFLSQIVGITQALEAIREAADISPQLLMGGAIVSFYAPIWGFIVFIFSFLFWIILKEIIRIRMDA